MRRASPAIALIILLTAAGCEEPDPGELFERGLYEDARRDYRQALSRDPGSPLVHYDLGATELRLGRHEAARPHLEIAARDGAGEVRQWAQYNVGNSHLEPVVLDAAEDRIASLGRAIVAYKRALLLDPGDQDAKWNLELARRLLVEEQRSPRPRPSPGAGAGGGGDEGGGESDASPAGGAPSPSPATPGATSPRLSRAEAERLLDQAELRELSVQREKLTRPQPPVTSH